MTSYLVEINLPDNYTEEFEQRVPHQRYMVNKLMEKGTIIRDISGGDAAYEEMVEYFRVR